MPTSPRNALRSPLGTDSPNIAQYFQNLASDVDSALTPILVGQLPILGGSVPANAKMRAVAGSSVVTTINAGGGFNLPYGLTFAGIVTLVMSPGDSVGGLVSVVANGVAAASAGGIAYGAAAALGNGVNVRVNYFILGWIA